MNSFEAHELADELISEALTASHYAKEQWSMGAERESRRSEQRALLSATLATAVMLRYGTVEIVKG